MPQSSIPEPPYDPTCAPKWADNKTDLARALKVSRQTIHDWGKFPGCPGARSNGRYCIAEWIDFRASIGSDAGEPLAEKVELEARRLEIQCRRLEWQFARERGEWTANELIGSEVRRLASELITALRHELEVALPRQCAHKSAEDVRALNGAALDRIMRRIHTGAAGIDAQFPAPAEIAPAEEPPAS